MALLHPPDPLPAFLNVVLKGVQYFWVWPGDEAIKEMETQISIKCQLYIHQSAGIPSGHVMISTAVLLTCTHYIAAPVQQPPSTLIPP